MDGPNDLHTSPVAHATSLDPPNVGPQTWRAQRFGRALAPSGRRTELRAVTPRRHALGYDRRVPGYPEGGPTPATSYIPIPTELISHQKVTPLDYTCGIPAALMGAGTAWATRNPRSVAWVAGSTFASCNYLRSKWKSNRCPVNICKSTRLTSQMA